MTKVTQPAGFRAVQLLTPQESLPHSFLQKAMKGAHWKAFFPSEFTRVPTANTPNKYGVSRNLEIHTSIPILEMKKRRGHREVINSTEGTKPGSQVR